MVSFTRQKDTLALVEAETEEAIALTQIQHIHKLMQKPLAAEGPEEE